MDVEARPHLIDDRQNVLSLANPPLAVVSRRRGISAPALRAK
jgi:hypothetical protein